MTKRALKILVMDDDAGSCSDTLPHRSSAPVRRRHHRAAFNRLNVVREHQPDLTDGRNCRRPRRRGRVTSATARSYAHPRRPVLPPTTSARSSAGSQCGAVGYISKSEMGWSFSSQVERQLRSLKL